ncbi:MAG TPA: hypothetical protein VF802_03055, partial [Candidatus Limnocylindrales bacterium]
LMIQTGDGSTCQGTVTLTGNGLTSVCADANGSWVVTLAVSQLSRRSITGSITLTSTDGSGSVGHHAAPSAGPLAPSGAGQAQGGGEGGENESAGGGSA